MIIKIACLSKLERFKILNWSTTLYQPFCLSKEPVCYSRDHPGQPGQKVPSEPGPGLNHEGLQAEGGPDIHQ